MAGYRQVRDGRVRAGGRVPVRPGPAESEPARVLDSTGTPVPIGVHPTSVQGDRLPGPAASASGGVGCATQQQMGRTMPGAGLAAPGGPGTDIRQGAITGGAGCELEDAVALLPLAGKRLRASQGMVRKRPGARTGAIPVGRSRAEAARVMAISTCMKKGRRRWAGIRRRATAHTAAAEYGLENGWEWTASQDESDDRGVCAGGGLDSPGEFTPRRPTLRITADERYDTDGFRCERRMRH